MKKTGNIGTHSDDIATYKAALGSAKTALQTVAAEMGAYHVGSAHLSIIVKNAIRELDRAYRTKQGN